MQVVVARRACACACACTPIGLGKHAGRRVDGCMHAYEGHFVVLLLRRMDPRAAGNTK
jgi:hypothetical protein